MTTSQYSSPEVEFIRNYSGDFKNFNGADYEAKIIKYNDKHWIVKQSGDTNVWHTESLIFQLGGGIVNVAEIKLLTQEETIEISQVIPLDTSAIYHITRVAQEYTTEELPLKDLDSATAGELVFSTWLRRRDTHEFNRAYNSDGIPVFFDHNFGVNFANNEDANIFFSKQGKGFAGNWIVEKINSKEDIFANSNFRGAKCGGR